MITQERLKELFRYDPESGEFYWRTQIGKRPDLVGERAGCLRADGYRCIGINGMHYLEHRLAWLYVFGELPPLELDHINRDRSCNKIANLREATNTQNQGNSRARRDGLKGAFWRKHNKKWTSSIVRNGRRAHLGYFDTEEDAHAAYCEAAKEKYKEFFHSGIPTLPSDASAT